MDYRNPSTIPLPTTDEEFERLCLLIARDKYGAEYYRYGRKGQSQYGIDIYSAFYDGRCIQCKLHKEGITDSILIRELKNDLKKAKSHFIDLKEFIFAVSVKTRTSIQNSCKELSDDNLKIIPWFWNQLQEDIARSKWLLRYYLDNMPGGQWINDDFVEQELKKGDNRGLQPINFYSSNIFAQWYGVLKNWDAPRQHYKSICQTIADSFADPINGIPTAAVVRGVGGIGKSVLLRRIALNLRNDYTIYWISDNAEDFLGNEWIYDIEYNPNEKYLLIIEDWYRNFSKTDDRIIANKLIQKVKSKPNLRLLIGDRPHTQTNYPKSKQIIFDLRHKENSSLLTFITDQIPEWKNKFSEQQKSLLLDTGLFQLLFVYQYFNSSKSYPKAANYFLEIIQSDCNQLCKRVNPFYKGLAQAFYVYANIYSDYSIRLSPEAIIILAESYSGTKRPANLIQNCESLTNDSIVRRYFYIIKSEKTDKLTIQFRFLHDTFADEGWKNIEVDSQTTLDSIDSLTTLLPVLKTEATCDDLSITLYRIVTLNPSYLSTEQVIFYCDFLIKARSESSYYLKLLYEKNKLDIHEQYRIDILHKIGGLANKNDGIWGEIIRWLKFTNNLNIQNLECLVSKGNVSYSVLSNYFRLINLDELKPKAIAFLSDQNLTDRYYGAVVPILFKRLSNENEIKELAIKYLNLPEAWKIKETFSTCIQLYSDELIAKEKSLNYLELPEAEVIHQNYVACLKCLDSEALGIISTILRSPIDKYNYQIVYTALEIASKVQELNSTSEDMVNRILKNRPHNFDTTNSNIYYLFLQIMKIPLFHIITWQQEVNELLNNYKFIHRNLMYSLTISHSEQPEPLTEASLFFIRNWKNEFSKPKRFWGYFIRSLAHPIIQEQPKLKEEIRSLCKQMLLTDNCPNQLKAWLTSIDRDNKFPEWKRTLEDDFRPTEAPASVELA